MMFQLMWFSLLHPGVGEINFRLVIYSKTASNEQRARRQTGSLNAPSAAESPCRGFQPLTKPLICLWSLFVNEVVYGPVVSWCSSPPSPPTLGLCVFCPQETFECHTKHFPKGSAKLHGRPLGGDGAVHFKYQFQSQCQRNLEKDFISFPLKRVCEVLTEAHPVISWLSHLWSA